MHRFAVLVVVAGCGGLDLEDFAAERTDAQCGYLVRCDAIASVADCRAHYERTALDSPNIAAAVEAGKLRYDEAAAEACIAAYSTLSCDTTKQTTDVLSACDGVLTGTLDNGEACGFDLECVSDWCAQPSCDAACCIGTCGPKPSLPGIGQPCTSLCDGEAYCGADAYCHALLPEGAACDDFSVCGYGLHCADGGTTGSGICTPLPHLGEPCEAPCAEVNAICIYGMCYAAGVAGDSCRVEFECAEFYTCGADQKCALPPTLGMPCSDRCSGNAYCEANVCVEQKPNGSSCTYNDECRSHYCDDTTCSDVALCI